MQDKRYHILRTTEQLLRTHGLHGLSMSKIVQAAGVSTGTIYRYFRDKDDLIRAMHHESAEELGEALKVGIDKGSYQEKIFTLVENLINYNRKYPERYVTKAALDLASRDVADLHEELRGYFAEILDLIEKGREEGIFKQLPNDILIGLALGPIEFNCRLNINSIYSFSETEMQCLKLACWDAIYTHPE
ncbi:TetR/AcrR family transcriptional regulator [Pokkaliibacter sp. CJK22405]|uniref:TetR/AcrR family transcriptional regulator n=1 Tax=Pokkaliibacter sp. CJK22405 TaxID=3384615 RepID=UPI0039851003